MFYQWIKLDRAHDDRLTFIGKSQCDDTGILLLKFKVWKVNIKPLYKNVIPWIALIITLVK